MQENAALKGLIAVVVLAAIAGGVFLFTGDDSDTDDNNTASTSQQTTTANATETQTDATTQTTPTQETTQNETSQESQVDAKYTDGTYSSIGTYGSPGGDEDIDVVVTLEDDKITEVTLTNLAEHETGKMFQEKFISGVISLVTGVSLDDADVDVVSGSSLTSTGFNAALDDIRLQAS